MFLGSDCVRCVRGVIDHHHHHNKQQASNINSFHPSSKSSQPNIIIMKFLHGAVALLAIIVVTNAPINATNAPTNAPTNTCFPDRVTLRTAVNDYISQGCRTNSTCAIGQKYGYPINNWCTSQITDMASLFFHENTFNDNIADWDVGSVTNMAYMFDSASVFNQDISGWKVHFTPRRSHRSQTSSS